MKHFAAIVLAVCVLPPCLLCASDIPWCYHLPSCNDTTWPTTIAPMFCNGSRQSPINIVREDAIANENLTAFTFVNYNDTSALDKIENTGRTIKVTLKSGVKISGGNLTEEYDSLQFHLHWGNGTMVGGSEHTVDGVRYPMELHIVNSKAKFNRNTTLAVGESDGLAALGFFIEEQESTDNSSLMSWMSLTSYLANITESGTSVSITPGFSLDDLLHGVNRTMYYRYLGSLTTPNCNEAVVWTVFKQTIKLPKSVIDQYSTTVRVGNSSSPLAVNTYRNVQPDLRVFTQPTSHSAPTTCYTLGVLLLTFVLGRNCI
ncbi:carbonic anhydrase 4-like [Pholidichthys leucotaenia]